MTFVNEVMQSSVGRQRRFQKDEHNNVLGLTKLPAVHKKDKKSLALFLDPSI